MGYDFSPFADLVTACGEGLLPLAVPVIATYLGLSWIADLLFRS